MRTPATGRFAKRNGPFAIVFMTYAKSFHGVLYLRGYNKNGREIARSEPVTAPEKAEPGGHQRFAFDRDTRFKNMQSFKLEGRSTPTPKEGSFGEKTEQIVNNCCNRAA